MSFVKCSTTATRKAYELIPCRVATSLDFGLFKSIVITETVSTPHGKDLVKVEVMVMAVGSTIEFATITTTAITAITATTVGVPRRNYDLNSVEFQPSIVRDVKNAYGYWHCDSFTATKS